MSATAAPPGEPVATAPAALAVGSGSGLQVAGRQSPIVPEPDAHRGGCPTWIPRPPSAEVHVDPGFDAHASEDAPLALPRRPVRKRTVAGALAAQLEARSPAAAARQPVAAGTAPPAPDSGAGDDLAGDSAGAPASRAPAARMGAADATEAEGGPGATAVAVSTQQVPADPGVEVGRCKFMSSSTSSTSAGSSGIRALDRTAAGKAAAEAAPPPAAGSASIAGGAHDSSSGPCTCELVAGQGDDLEFEIWVETDLQASWCLEDTGGAAASSQWRGSCQTGLLRRRWEEFEALGQADVLGSAEMLPEEALHVLGLPPDASASQLAHAFRNQSRVCHPDKVGPSAAFDALVTAYHVAQRALSETR